MPKYFRDNCFNPKYFISPDDIVDGEKLASTLTGRSITKDEYALDMGAIYDIQEDGLAFFDFARLYDVGEVVERIAPELAENFFKFMRLGTFRFEVPDGNYREQLYADLYMYYHRVDEAYPLTFSNRTREDDGRYHLEIDDANTGEVLAEYALDEAQIRRALSMDGVRFNNRHPYVGGKDHDR